MSETEVSHLFPKRVFIIGAGMSADCGVPIIRNLLEDRFLSLVNEEDQKKILKFLSDVYLPDNTPNIEEILSEIDNCLIEGSPLKNYSLEELSSLRQVFVNAIIEIIAKTWDKINTDLDIGPIDNPYAAYLCDEEDMGGVIRAKNILNMERELEYYRLFVVSCG